MRLGHGRQCMQPRLQPCLTHQLPRGCRLRAPRATASAPAAPALHPDIGKVLFSRDQINACLERLGSQLGKEYAGKPVLLVGVLKGGFMFTADLARHIHPPPPILEIDFLKASSYGVGRSSTSGIVKIDNGFDLASCVGRHVVVVEDIVDSGLTLSAIVELLKSGGHAESVKVCALLDKRARRKVVFEADYVGFECPDEFVVGYGIDYSEMYRFLPYIGVPTPAAVSRVAAEGAARHKQQLEVATGSDDQSTETR